MYYSVDNKFYFWYGGELAPKPNMPDCEYSLEPDVLELVADCYEKGLADSNSYLKGQFCWYMQYYSRYVSNSRDEDLGKEYYGYFSEHDLDGDGIITKFEDFQCIMRELADEISNE